MKSLVYCTFLAAIIVCGHFASIYFDRIAKIHKAIKIDEQNFTARKKSYDARLSSAKEEYSHRLKVFRNSRAHMLTRTESAFKEKMRFLEDAVKNREQVQEYWAARDSHSYDKFIPGLHKLGGEEIARAEDIGSAESALRLVRLKDNGTKCDFEYKNEGDEPLKPDIEVFFFDANGCVVGSARNTWRFSKLQPGQHVVETESVDGCAASACYYRVK